MMERLIAHQGKSDLQLALMPRLLYRRRRLIIVFTITATIIAAAINILMPNYYVSTGTLLPTGTQSQAGFLYALAFALPGLELRDTEAEATSSSQLFPEFLRSDLICTHVLETELPIRIAAEELAETVGETFASSPTRAMARLRKATSIEKDKITGMISVGVKSTNPYLAQFIASEYIRQLDSYCSSERFARLDEDRVFILARLSETEQRLKAAEDTLLSFRGQNRNYYNSTAPDLQLEQQRLERKVQEVSQVYSLLTQQLELATIEAKRKKPIVAALDMPQVPLVKAGPLRVRNVIQVTLAALILVCGGVIAADYFRARHSPSNSQRGYRQGDAVTTEFSGMRGRLSFRRRAPA